MHFLSQIIGALVEAWGEVKVQKARVILSLVGVVAAVAAMTTVIALGELTQQSLAEMQETFSGRSVTLRIDVNQKASEESPLPQLPEPGNINTSTRGEDAQGRPLDPIGDAMSTVAARFKIPYWSHIKNQNLELREYIEAQNSGFFRGKPIIPSEWGGFESPQISAVDPHYQVLFRLRILHGRWLHEDDWLQRVAPAVINEVMWDRLGQPDIYNPIILNANDDTGRTYRIVGVVAAKNAWESPQMYVSYEGAKYTTADTQTQTYEPVSMLVWVGEDQLKEARRILPPAVAAVLGSQWEGSAGGGEDIGLIGDQSSAFTNVIMVIGAIVIFLGALGLLNVAIVTVRQRIREIGIRRAMGASAGRVFFAVFMESVVATFVAGIIGVGIAIVAVRFIPLEYLEITLQDRPAFPMNAAVIGVAISTAIGALCGIIPALAAISVKPIDAIRY